MKLTKKVKCNRCGSVVEENGVCNCGTITMVEGVVQNAYPGKDYTDISAKLLNENV